MKVTQMPPVHAANVVANSGNIAYGVDVIVYITSTRVHLCSHQILFFTLIMIHKQI